AGREGPPRPAAPRVAAVAGAGADRTHRRCPRLGCGRARRRDAARLLLDQAREAADARRGATAMTGGTPPLFMIQLEPDMHKAARWMEAQKVTRLGHDDGYGWHALLAACFGDLAPKPFRMIERPRRSPQLLGYGPHDIATLREHAAAF